MPAKPYVEELAPHYAADQQHAGGYFPEPVQALTVIDFTDCMASMALGW